MVKINFTIKWLQKQYLRKKNFNVFDEVTIVSNIPEKIQAQFYEMGGFETVQTLMDFVSPKNLDGYIESLYTENMLLD